MMTLGKAALVLAAVLMLLTLAVACQASGSVMATVRSAWDPIMVSASEHFRFTFAGKVTIIDPDSFWLDDGSPYPLRVISPGYSGLKTGDWLRATGTVTFEDDEPVLMADDLTSQGYPTLLRLISGHLRTASGTPVAGVYVYASNGECAYTDSDGYYSVRVPKGWSGSLTLSPHYLFTFAPESRDYANVTMDRSDQDFEAVAKPIISGYVRTLGGTPLENVQVYVAADGYDARTDSDGHYGLLVPTGWSGRVDILPSYDYAFDPGSRQYADVTADQPNQDFTATPNPIISGYIRTADGKPVAHAFVHVSGIGDWDTDDSGHYAAYIPSGWSGTLTAWDPSFTFSPPARDYANVTADQPEQDFEAISKLIVSGYIKTADGTPIGDVRLYRDDYADVTTTDSSGHYSFAVPSGWSGRIWTFFHRFYTFSPDAHVYADVTSDQPDQHFQAIPKIVISGYARTGDGTPIEYAYVEADGSGVANTDADGFYSFGEPAGWSGTVRISHRLYCFASDGRLYENLLVNQSDQNYEAVIKPVISGWVRTMQGTGISSVYIGTTDASLYAYTNLDGDYFLPVPPGWSGTLTTYNYYYDCDPASRTYAAVTADLHDNYEAVPKPPIPPPSSPSRPPADSP